MMVFDYMPDGQAITFDFATLEYKKVTYLPKQAVHMPEMMCVLTQAFLKSEELYELTSGIIISEMENVLKKSADEEHDLMTRIAAVMCAIRISHMTLDFQSKELVSKHLLHLIASL